MATKKQTSKQGIFETHGFDEAGTSGDQVYGNCVLCGKDGKFYLNPLTGQWDCKVCGAEGNAVTFLESFHEMLLSENRHYKKLGRLRQLPAKVFRPWGVVFDDIQERWLIPTYNDSGRIADLRTWCPGVKGVRSTKGCKSQLMGLDLLTKMKPGIRRTIFVCEGEWDAMALAWVLNSTDEPADAWNVVGLPGAGTFKKEWLPWFKGHDVVLCYDNDAAGFKGREKVAGTNQREGLLRPYAKRLFMIQWPEAESAAVPDGFDLRDFIVECRAEGMDAKEIQIAIKKLTVLIPRKGAADGAEDMTAAEKEELEPDLWDNAIPYIEIGSIPEDEIPTIETVIEVFEDNIEMTEDMEIAIRIMLAHGFSAKSPGDPVWTYIIGPPGCGKTLLLMSMQGSERCAFHSNLTPKGLVSGFNTNPDPSLLPQWDKQCTVLKDFTEVMASHPQEREAIYGTLRGAFDGHVQRTFGNGVVREYWLRFSLLAGVTPAIHGDRMAMMGERFLKYEMMKGNNWNADKQIRAAIQSISNESERETAMMEVVGRFLSRDISGKKLPKIPRWMEDRVVAISQLSAALRANVERERYTGDLSYRPVREVGTRIAKQLCKLAMYLAVVSGSNKVSMKNYRIVERVAFDTATGFHLDLVQALIQMGGASTRKEIAKAASIPESTLARALEDLLALSIVNKKALDGEGVRGRPQIEWSLKAWIVDLWKRSKVGEDYVERGSRIRKTRSGGRRTRKPQVRTKKKSRVVAPWEDAPGKKRTVKARNGFKFKVK